MDNFNKVISFILGLVVVVVFLAILASRFNLRGKFLPLSKNGVTVTNTKGTPTPTPVKGKLVVDNSTGSAQTKGGDPNYHSYSNNAATSGNVNSIPKTGPELLLPLALSSLVGGFALRRKAGK